MIQSFDTFHSEVDEIVERKRHSLKLKSLLIAVSLSKALPLKQRREGTPFLVFLRIAGREFMSISVISILTK